MGLGPAIFGLCFYLSHVHLDEQMVAVTTTTNKFNIVHPPSISTRECLSDTDTDGPFCYSKQLSSNIVTHFS